MKRISFVIAFLALCPLCSANGDILYDNGVTPATVDSNLLSDYDNSAFGYQEFAADDFSIATNAVLTGASWTGVYAPASATPPSIDDFEIAFFDDVGGSPGLSPFLSFDVDVVRIDSGFDIPLNNLDIYQYSTTFDSPLVWNNPDPVWISIRNRTFGEMHDWFWGSMTAGTSGNSYFMRDGAPWMPTFGHSNHDFRLHGNPVPEPSGILLLTLLGGIVLVRRPGSGKVDRSNF